MFSYFGSKSEIIDLYPPPEYATIIEPFCGSARYACKWGLDPDKDVWINDLYGPIYRIWKWIQQATLADIEALPELSAGDDLRVLQGMPIAIRDLLGFCVGRGRNSPGQVMTGWGAVDNEIGRTKNRLRPLVGKISHWRITQLDYRQVKVKYPALYFVDPPYQRRKCDYVLKTPSDFYTKCGDYCRSLRGRVIVCEGAGADWLPFSPLVSQMGQRRVSEELICVLDRV